MKGIEVDIIYGFQIYFKKHYQIDLSIQWLKEEAFTDVIIKMNSNNHDGIFGVAGFSISDERKKTSTNSVMVVASNNFTCALFSSPSVKRKIPLLAQLSPLIVIPAIILIIMRPKDEVDFVAPPLPANN